MEENGWKASADRLLAAAGGPLLVYIGIPAFVLLSLAHDSGLYFLHDLAQMVSIVIAAGIFMLTWNGRRFLDNHYFLFLGISLLFVGIIDSLHVLAFDGWIGGQGSYLDTRLWYAARYLLGISLVIAPRYVERKVRPGVTLAIFFASGVALVGLVARWAPMGWFQHDAHPWITGVIDLSLVSLGIAGYLLLRRKREHFDRVVHWRLSLSILLAIVSVSLEGLGMRGLHVGSIACDMILSFSFYLIYLAVIETGMERPYDLMFRNLKRSEEEALAARSDLEVRVAERTMELRGVNERLERELASRRAEERERELTIELLREITGAGTIKELVTGITSFLRARSGCESVRILYRAGANSMRLKESGFTDGSVHSGRAFCIAGEKAEPAGERLALAEDCICGDLMPGVFNPSRKPFPGEDAFWTNSVTTLLSEGAEFRRAGTGSRGCREGFESMALVPLRSGGETIGVLQFCDHRKGLFSAEAIKVFDRLADHVAVALARHAAKEALRESEGRFRSLVENVPAGIQIVQEGRVIFANPGVRRILGEIPVGGRFRDIGEVLPEDQGKFDAFCTAIERAEADRRDMELRFTPAVENGGQKALRWVLCQTEWIEYQGKPATLVVLNDLTQMKDLEQIVSTREKLSIIGQMAAGIAHEIRNPLSGININVTALEHVIRGLEEVSPADRDRIGEIVHQAKSASDKIAMVIRRVMDFSKQVPPELARVDVNQVVREVLAFSSATLKKNGFAVSESLLPDLPRCSAEPRLLEQVLLNLVTNAIEAMENVHGGKRLGVGTCFDDGSIVIRVFDNGPGVPLHNRERVFEPFYTTRKTGHGIGLSFSRRVVENHGGTLTASESEWGGAEFRISLPAVAERSPA